MFLREYPIIKYIVERIKAYRSLILTKYIIDLKQVKIETQKGGWKRCAHGEDSKHAHIYISFNLNPLTWENVTATKLRPLISNDARKPAVSLGKSSKVKLMASFSSSSSSSFSWTHLRQFISFQANVCVCYVVASHFFPPWCIYLTSFFHRPLKTCNILSIMPIQPLPAGHHSGVRKFKNRCSLFSLISICL